MGYAGGTTPNPTYENIGNHSETIQVEYDPSVVSYERLLAAFWSGHEPVYRSYSAQYRSAIFHVNEQQQNLAIESKKAEEARLGRRIYTDIEPYTDFYVAENYHQKYYLRQKSRVVKEFYSIYPNEADFRDSTAAARVNGFVGGYGDRDTLNKNLDRLGLSEPSKQALLEIAKSGLTAGCPVSPALKS